MRRSKKGPEYYREVAEMVAQEGNVAAFTGAGISVDSGIPAFRGGQGLWERYDPMEYAHIEAFYRNPEKVWHMLREMSDVLIDAKPNDAHKALGEMERKGLLKAVITQNVDGLHHMAGNSNVIEYHGNHRWLVCPACKKRIPLAREVTEIIPFPRCDKCDRALKPDVVFFGEGIPILAVVRANEVVETCKVMFLIGTSGVVYPAAELPYVAKANGATIVEINIDPTPFTDNISEYYFQGTATEVLPEIMKHLR